ncbi:MAG: FkbM family methyltransferase [Aphanocapsa sp. GSE-SYN-MK-11-07L]|jgi:FkbM family methyltransferase|nr:FkbM family methyltransferase [Aphanocapsa sp. GSE-SYN-MK-11-07L]
MIRLASLFKPEYLFQPQVLLNRLLPKSAVEAEFTKVRLPWGMQIRVRPSEEHGQILMTLGVIDLAVTEVVWRLTDCGESAIDVGANIGYMTAVMLQRLGDRHAQGQLHAFEAHPDIYLELENNLQIWQQQLPHLKVVAHQLAVSEQPGTVALAVPKTFATNRGLAAVVEAGSVIPTDADLLSVRAIALDQFFSPSQPIGVLKLDVEGHELSALRGAEQLLQNQTIRDCVFEEHRPYPTDVTRWLEGFGYQLFRIQRQFWGPQLLPANTTLPRTPWLPTSFLATSQPERAIARLQQPGWHALRAAIKG